MSGASDRGGPPSVVGLPLFDFTPRPRPAQRRYKPAQRLNVGERYVARRYGLSTSHARLVAEMQGYGDKGGGL